MNKPDADVWNHRPLPYIVLVKEITSEDAVPVTHTVRVVAYSIAEAWMSAVMQLSGSGFSTADKYTPLRIEPDLMRYMTMTLTGEIPPTDDAP